MIVSIPPQKWLVEQIGGKHVSVNALVSKGDNPVSFEPRPSAVKKVKEAKLYFTISVPFEKLWLGKLKKLNKNIELVACDEGVKKIDLSHSHDGHGHNHSKDPHIWLSIKELKIICKTIKTALAKHDGKNAADYEQNYTALVKRFEALDKTIGKSLADLNERSLMVYHPSWSYFFRDYKLEQIAIESENKEPSLRELKELIKEAKEHRVGVILVQKQFPQRAAKRIAESISAKIIVTDPLEEDIEKNLRNFCKQLTENMK